MSNNPLCNTPTIDQCFRATSNGLQLTSQKILIKEAKEISKTLGDKPLHIKMEDYKLPMRRKEFLTLNNEEVLPCIQEHLNAICTKEVDLTEFSSKLDTWSQEVIAQGIDDTSYLNTLTEVANAIWINRIENIQRNKDIEKRRLGKVMNIGVMGAVGVKLVAQQ